MPPERRRQSATALVSKRARNAYGRLSRRNESESQTAVGTATRNSGAFFFRIPKELRDQIYHEIWKTKPPFEVVLPKKGDHCTQAQAYSLSDNYYIFEILYEQVEKPKPKPTTNKRARPSRPPPPWILANKQILSEAMEQFNRQATWIFQRAAGSHSREERQSVAWKPLPAMRRTTRQSPILLTLDGAATIRSSNPLTMLVHIEMDCNEKPTSRAQLDTASVEFLQALNAGLANLKRLSLVLVADAWPRWSIDHSIMVDLQVLESLDLPSLQLFQLSVRHTEPFADDANLMRELRESVGKMGRGVVGGDGREKILEVFEPEWQPEWLTGIEWQHLFTRR